MERRLICQGYFATACCGGIGFDSGRGEQIAYFGQCRLLLETVDLCQICQMLCFRKECSKNPLPDFQNRKTGGNVGYTYLSSAAKQSWS